MPPETPDAPPPYAEFNPDRLPETPAFVVDLAALERNARLLAGVREHSGAKVLLALKGFAMPTAFPLLARYLDGVTASGLHEALLGEQHFRHAGHAREVHVYSPAFKAGEIDALLPFAHTLVFNSPNQWKRFRPAIDAAEAQPDLGLRVNHGHGEVAVDLYNPAAPDNRLGTPAESLSAADISGLNGLHFHTLCEQGVDVLARTLEVFEAKCSRWFTALDWLNFGGGHHITQPSYDRDRLCDLLRRWQQRYGVQVYLEPGEAVAIHTGVLVAEVLDVVAHGGVRTAILDTSATAHMPDVLEMPYRPQVRGAGLPGELPHPYRLGGLTCLAGDVIGDYSFPSPLEPGQRLVFDDMAHYTMVKTTTFNGVPHPSLVTWDPVQDALKVVRRFTYEDFRSRLG